MPPEIYAPTFGPNNKHAQRRQLVDGGDLLADKSVPISKLEDGAFQDAVATKAKVSEAAPASPSYHDDGGMKAAHEAGAPLENEQRTLANGRHNHDFTHPDVRETLADPDGATSIDDPITGVTDAPYPPIDAEQRHRIVTWEYDDAALPPTPFRVLAQYSADGGTTWTALELVGVARPLTNYFVYYVRHPMNFDPDSAYPATARYVVIPLNIPTVARGGRLIRAKYDGTMHRDFHAEGPDRVYRGTDAPEGAVEANPGSLYLQAESGAIGRVWVKRTGTGDEGWFVVGPMASDGAGKTADFDIDLGYTERLYVCDTDSGDIEVGLPSDPPLGFSFGVVKTHADNTLTFNPGGSHVVNDASTYDLTRLNQVAWFVYRETNKWTAFAEAGAQAPVSHIWQGISANENGSDSASAQPWFPANPGATVEAKTYLFEGLLSISRSAGSTLHTTAILFGGSATIASIHYFASCKTGDTAGLAGLAGFRSIVATATVVKAGSTSTSEQIVAHVRGQVRFSAGGDFEPQFQYSAAPGGTPTILADTFFRLDPMGDDAAEEVGEWA